ncbi:peroxiredoxin [Sulfodiicoccus acidiphilus]|uniref:Peroxiredoxin n=1 Tax=Sulfodiicoccus acidiphilus TaxID=1670455 RepID=A0A348B1E4_9CREN|nr:OsmC family protein [Sulfodiicoccus acidiphilus]BBD71996.1 peroxiredoxin [Sulfodiicoccus acidiphilus]GGT92000.1 peroxiredoxin [Sulfodiicoccus acidiphilus]
MTTITFAAEAKLEEEKVRVYVKDSELVVGTIGSDYPTPEELLLSAALSCLLLTLLYVAREMEVHLEEVDGYIEGDLDPAGFNGGAVPPGVLEVRYFVKVRSSDPRVSDVLNASERRCPLKDTLTRSVRVRVNWQLVHT